METPNEIFERISNSREAKYRQAGIRMDDKYMHERNVIKAMEEYADQWKYDFSKECKCTDSPGETWCCNLCGLPTTKHSAKQEAIEFAEHLLHGDWRLNPHSEKTLWRTVNQVEQLGGTKPIDEGITTEQVYKLFKELHP